MNILHEANEIVNNRSQEKERQYGPFDESMDNMRDIFNAMTGLNLSTEHMFDAMIAMKLARIRYSYKEDSYLDAAAYIGAKNNYVQNKLKMEEALAEASSPEDEQWLDSGSFTESIKKSLREVKLLNIEPDSEWVTIEEFKNITELPDDAFPTDLDKFNAALKLKQNPFSDLNEIAKQNKMKAV